MHRQTNIKYWYNSRLQLQAAQTVTAPGGHAITQAVRYLPLTGKAHIRSQVRLRGVVVDKAAVRQVPPSRVHFNENSLCMVSGFRRELDEICDLLGKYVGHFKSSAHCTLSL
jgi:hypothetical protein